MQPSIMHGHLATIAQDRTKPRGQTLSSTVFGSYVRVLKGIQELEGQICLWTYSSELIPLGKPGNLYSSNYGADFCSTDIFVEVLDKGECFTVTVTGKIKSNKEV